MISAHPRTWFPFVLIVLTLGLLIFILFLYQIPEQSDSIELEGSYQPIGVDQELYRGHVQSVVNDLDLMLSGASNKDEELVHIQNAQNQLFGLIVPTDDQQTHLVLVIALNKMIEGHLQDDQEKIETGFTEWEAKIEQLNWLQ